MVELIETLLVVVSIQLLYGFLITGASYVLVSQVSVNDLSLFQDQAERGDINSFSTNFRGSLEDQTSFSILDLGAIAIYTGSFILDLVLNSIFAVPSLVSLVLSVLFNYINIPAKIEVALLLIISGLISIAFYAQMLGFLAGIRSQGGLR